MVELMPDKYAMAAGLGNIGTSFGILFWGWVALLLANPNNESPDIEIRENSRMAYYFGEAVASRVPYFFWVLTMMAIGVVL